MRAAFIAVLVTVTGCEKADDLSTRSAPRAALASPAPRASVNTAAGLTRVSAPAPAMAIAAPVTVPAGWTAEQDVDGRWSFRLPSGATVRLDRAPADVATTATGYLEYKLEWSWDPGTSADIVSSESRPGGFAATLLVRTADDPDHPRLAYHAVWNADGVRTRCEADALPDEASRDQVAAMCASARW